MSPVSPVFHTVATVSIGLETQSRELTVTLSKLGEGGILDSEVFTIVPQPFVNPRFLNQLNK